MVTNQQDTTTGGKTSDYHEPPKELDQNTRNYTRALKTLSEEIEAIYWYNERITLTDDDQLEKILTHNRNEEMEHAAMSLEWLRRNMSGWDTTLRSYLFSDAEITSLADE